MRKCDSFCDAKAPNLWLRNNVFYYIIELPRVGEKRCYKRVSLHTNNFYEAREKVKNMVIMDNPNNLFNDIRRLLSGLVFETGKGKTGDYQAISTLPTKPKLSKRNNPNSVNELLLSSYFARQIPQNTLTLADRELLNRLERLVPALEEFLSTAKTGAIKTAPTPRTIVEVLESMLLKAQNSKGTANRKRRILTAILGNVGLTLDMDYSNFHNQKIIETITKNITDRTDIMGDVKRKYIRFVKELATCGSNFDPDNYKINIINNLPKIAGTKKADRNPHQAYSKEQLLEIFDSKHDFFKDNPDMFFTCMIGIFTGARINAAATLQYNNVIVKDGIDCIEIIGNHPIKNLKTEGSERVVPIHSQLLDLGFVDYVKRHQKKAKAADTDFIFPRCKTSGEVFYEKYPRIFFNFIRDIGIKAPNGRDGLDFHSFRKNANTEMINAGISGPYINRIIGWESKDMSSGTYFNPTLTEIKTELEKFSYDFLAPHFVKWKKIMAIK